MPFRYWSRVLGSPPRSRGILTALFSAVVSARLTPAFAGNTRPARWRRAVARAHPRVRGEYLGAVSARVPGTGSPPRSRGIHPGRRHRGQDDGLTPAFAGNTHTHAGCGPRTRAHPRVRGEYLTLAGTHRGLQGSPPRSRGIRSSSGSPSSTRGAHPRVRGEYALPQIIDAAVAGSPPRSRGIPAGAPSTIVEAGLTPAFAGNTQRGDRVVPVLGAHPRVRGEYSRSKWGKLGSAGSPPRSRGILPHHHRRHRGRRLTPAFAGNTVGAAGVRVSSPAHPRVRGEYIEPHAEPGAAWGSPPRSRGIRGGGDGGGVRGGLTPAFAGNTRDSTCRAAIWPAHPRVRGEYRLGRLDLAANEGSPPRSRGIPGHRGLCLSFRGLTPAFAGNTGGASTGE